MTNLTKKMFCGAVIRVATLALFLVTFGATIVFAQTKAYVTNSNDNTVSVIDTSTNTVIATIPVGFNPVGIAVKPNGARVYVAHGGTPDFSVINAATNTVIATVALPEIPFGVAITPNGAFAYITNGNALSGQVSVIDTGGTPSSPTYRLERMP